MMRLHCMTALHWHCTGYACKISRLYVVQFRSYWRSQRSIIILMTLINTIRVVLFYCMLLLFLFVSIMCVCLVVVWQLIVIDWLIWVGRFNTNQECEYNQLKNSQIFVCQFITYAALCRMYQPNDKSLYVIMNSVTFCSCI